MAREMKVGIAVIGVLLVVFCGLLAKRLTRPTKLPLTSISSTGGAKPIASQAKSPVSSIRPTVVMPQAEPAQPQNDLWTGRNSVDSKSPTHRQDRYGATLPPGGDQSAPDATAGNAQPGLLAAPTPIPDLQGTAGDNSAGTLPHQSAYAGDSDAQQPEANSAAAESHQVVDPFQSKPTAKTPPRATVAAPPTGRYADFSSADGIQSVAASDPFSSSRSANPPNLPANSYRNASPTPAAPAQRYSADSYDTNFSSPVQPSSTARTQNGSSAPSGAPIASGNSQWPQATMTSNVTPVSPSPPMQRDGEKYSVQPNDTFWTVSEKAYGSGAFFKALYEYNRKQHRQADELVIGQELLVPDENVLRRHYPDLCPRPRKAVANTEQRLMTASTKMRGSGRVYQVVEGDTLYDIAKFELGKSSRWAEVYELNRDVLGDDFDYLRPGTELILPADAPRQDSVTRQPDQTAPIHYGRY